MSDTFKQTRRHDFATSDPDLQGMGHTKRRNQYRKQQNRRVRRVLKQALSKELY